MLICDGQWELETAECNQNLYSYQWLICTEISNSISETHLSFNYLKIIHIHFLILHKQYVKYFMHVQYQINVKRKMENEQEGY